MAPPTRAGRGPSSVCQGRGISAGSGAAKPAALAAGAVSYLMNRRSFIAGATALLTAPLAVEAQQAGKVFRIGVLSPIPLTTLEASSVPSLSKAHGSSSANDSGRWAVNRYGNIQWA